MIQRETRRRRFAVLTSATLVVALAGLLAVRVTARPDSPFTPAAAMKAEVPVAPVATVPSPKLFVVADLPTPFCWACSENQSAPLVFQVSLDLLAPLGDGRANAALWFKDFAPGGSRYELEGKKVFRGRRVELSINGDMWLVLSDDDPLLLEAEPWVDQATCNFYPDVFKIDGINTSLPDLLMMIDLSRSWVARGKLANDPESAREDFQRAIRLGRLLRQDDVTLIQDLVAIACIRLGAEALYELAREEDDAATMVATSLVLADKDAIRLSTMRRMAQLEPALPAENPKTKEFSVQLTDVEFDRIIESLRELQDRRFRLEGLIGLQAVRHLGTDAQRAKAQVVLDELAQDPDELLANSARHFRDTPFDEASFRDLGD